MTDHADFYVGTGPDARWLGSLADLDHTAEPAGPLSAVAGLLAAATRSAYEAGVAALLAEHRAREVGFVALPGPGEAGGWPWLAATSGGWNAYTFVDGRVLSSARGGPWFVPNPDLPDRGAASAIGPCVELPVVGDTEPKKAAFAWSGFRFRGMPVPISTTLPPVSPDYLARRGEVALAVAAAVEEVVGRRWPLADLARPAVREAMHSLLRPGPAVGFHELPEDAPFAHERVVAALRFLIDAERYAEGNNAAHAADLRVSAADVAGQAVTAHRTHQPFPWPHR